MQGILFVAVRLGVFASLAGLVYLSVSFKPRKNALLSLAACFVLFGHAAASAPIESKGVGAEHKAFNTNAVANILVASNAAEVSDFDDDTNNLGADKESTSAAGNSAEEDVLQSQIAPDPSEISAVWTAFDAHNLSRVGFLIRVMRNRARQINDLLTELEAKMLEGDNAASAPDYKRELATYTFLATIRPDSKVYQRQIVKIEREIFLLEVQKKTERELAPLNDPAPLRVVEDKVDGITWYFHPNKPKYLNSRSTVYLYIGRRSDNGTPILRMRTIYTAPRWLFVDNVIAWHDGIREPFVSGVFNRDNNTSIWEWRDEEPDAQQIEVLRSLGNADEALLRFEGARYRKDVKLWQIDKKAIREILLAYEKMIGRSRTNRADDQTAPN